ncbi:hypothetical protein EUGRSUZ_H04181 [Eucalyptus grandis]|uniref:Uncharacterized protein n=2 Tax=Eucalyptus grandis TaxID=71139 RepID=A0ACC3JWX8_EUCGR|nr:hypothetical protein EUGRSUZ_H04181 [Eucalyptus grandis]
MFKIHNSLTTKDKISHDYYTFHQELPHSEKLIDRTDCCPSPLLSPLFILLCVMQCCLDRCLVPPMLGPRLHGRRCRWQV